MNIPSPRHPGAAVLRCLLGILIALVLGAALGLAIMATPAVTHQDLRVVVAANRALGPATSALARGIDVAGSVPMAAVVAVLAMLLCALLGRSVRAGLRGGIVIAVSWGAADLLKLLVRRPRPDPALLVHHLVPNPPSFSFPSGHTALAAAVCCAVLLTLRPGPARRVGTVLAVVVVATTAWSRVALGVHHPTDVAVSALLVPVICVLLARPLDQLLPMRHHGAEDARAGAEEVRRE